MPATSSERPGRRPNSALQDLWRQRLQRFERSGLSAVAFCAKEGVSTPAFYSWRRRLRQPSAEQTARPVQPPDADARLVPVRLLPVAPVELLLRGGGVLRLAPGCDLDFVRLLFAALGDLPC
jgi:transposase